MTPSDVPLVVDQLTDGVIDAAIQALSVVDSAVDRVNAALVDPLRKADWSFLSPVRSESSQFAARGQAFRRATSAAAKAAGRSNWAPTAGSATSNTVTGGVVHAPSAARSNGLWHLQALPSDADSSRNEWVNTVKMLQARSTEAAQHGLQAQVAAASASLRAVLASVERDTQAEVANAQAALDRSLAQGNASLALRLARVDARMQELQARAVSAAQVELLAAGVAEPNARQLAHHILQRLSEQQPKIGGQELTSPAATAHFAVPDAAPTADEVEEALAAAAAASALGSDEVGAAVLQRSAEHAQLMHSPATPHVAQPDAVLASERMRQEAIARVEALSRLARVQAERDAASTPRAGGSPSAFQSSLGTMHGLATQTRTSPPAPPSPIATVPSTPASPLAAVAASPVFDVSLGTAVSPFARAAHSGELAESCTDAPAEGASHPLAARLTTQLGGPRKTGAARKR